MNLLAAVTLAFTLPALEQGTGGCATDGSALSDLSYAFVYAQPVGSPDTSLAWCGFVHGQQGQRVTVSVNLPTPCGMWVRTTDFAGNWSCRSNVLCVGCTVSVPPAIANADTAWRDLQGRRAVPRTPGVYFRRGRKIAVRR